MVVPIIRVDHLSKRYDIGAREERLKTFREASTDLFLAPLRRLRRFAKPAPEAKEVWALKDLSFDVQAGDLVGAWRHYRAALRASRHVGMHGVTVQRAIGSAFLRQSRPRIEAWTENPKVTSELLRQAIASKVSP